MAEHTTSTRGAIDRRFYLFIAIAMVAAVVYGFAPSYYLRSLTEADPLPTILHWHGFVFTLWLVVLLAQVFLIRTRNPAMHRKLGYAAIAVAIAMIVLGVLATLERAPLTPDPTFFYSIALADLVAFAVFVSGGLLWRTKADFHKRFMLLATVAVIDAGIARLPGLSALLAADPVGWLSWSVVWAVTDIPLLAALVYDLRTRRLVHPVLLWGGAALVFSQFVRFAITRSEWWQTFSEYLKTLN